MTTADAVIKLLQDNLHLIFAEPDEEKRLAQLGRLWFADSECFFIDPLGVFTTHKSISDLTAGLLASNAGNIFTELAPGQVLFEDTENDTRIARLKWGFGLPGQKPALTGEDVATVVNGKIQKMFTFLD